MKTGIVLVARLGSTRLARKHLLKVNGESILFYLIHRIQVAFKQEIDQEKVKIIIATSNEPENQEFETFQFLGVSVFYGSLNNIPARQLQASEKHELDNIISVDGDDILCSTAGMKKVYEVLSAGEDYVQTTGLPFGMNVTGYTTEFLKHSLSTSKSKTLETGWGRIFDKSRLTVISFNLHQNKERLRFTLDYPEDYKFFNELITKFTGDLNTCSDQDIVDYVERENLDHITESVASEYWDNFNSGLKREIGVEEAH